MYIYNIIQYTNHISNNSNISIYRKKSKFKTYDLLNNLIFKPLSFNIIFQQDTIGLLIPFKYLSNGCMFHRSRVED